MALGPASPTAGLLQGRRLWGRPAFHRPDLHHISDFFASTGPAPERATFVPERLAVLGDKALGFFHIVTGPWLMYLMFADVLNAVLKFTLFI
jgi:hypothetical protein